MAGPLIGIVVGEVSGDTLGAGLIRALKQRYPEARFIGIAGPQMQAEGAESLYAMERLSVMGLVEVLGRLRELLHMRAELFSQLAQAKIDLFVGIDAPDFNLGLEQRLREVGIPTVHYVSPSVWAWRQGRVKTIKAAVDRMLCLLPFEKAFYDRHQLDAVFVGHPLADSLPVQTDVAAARARLGISGAGPVVAVLPGSRGGEVKYLAPLFVETMKRLAQERPGIRFLIPAINAARKQQIEAALAGTRLPVTLFEAGPGADIGRQVMAAADLILMASGTATLEAMLLKKPMVIAYKFHWFTWLLLSWLVRTPFVGLPNVLAGRQVVPELLQSNATPDKCVREVSRWLDQPAEREALIAEFEAMHRSLACNASERAAEAVADLLTAREAAHVASV